MKRVALQLEFNSLEEAKAFLDANCGSGAEVTVTTTPDTTINDLEARETGVDSEGVRWDERIHSSNKKTTAKGVWTRRRGVDDATYEAVKAELLGKPVVPPTVPTETVPPVATSPSLPTEKEVVTPTAPSTAGEMTLPLFLKQITMWTNEGKITPEMREDVAVACGLSKYQEVFSQKDPQLYSDFIATMKEMIGE